MDRGRDEKGSLTKRKLRFLENIKRVTLPVPFGNAGQIEKDVTLLRRFMEKEGESVSLIQNHLIHVPFDTGRLQKPLALFI
jgi:hypothetical protein